MHDNVEPAALESAPPPAVAETGLVAALRRFDPGSARLWARVVSFGLLAFLLGALVYRYGSYTSDLLHYPYDWDEDEGLSIYFGQRFANHEPIYVDFNKLPMLSACYPPVFAAATALAVSKFGATLLAGRLVSLAAMAASCIIVILAVRQETRRWSLGLLAAALILASPYVTTWGPLSRVDSLAMLLLLAGTLLVRQFPRYRILLPLGLILLLVACYTRYQAVFLVPAAFWHLWRTGRRTAVVSFVLFAAAGIATAVCLQRWSGGYFWRSTVTAQATEYLWGFFTQRTREFLQEHAILVAAAIGLLVHQIYRRDLDVWGALALTSVLNIVLAGKQGAAINYYIPTVVAAAICTAIAIDRLLRLAPASWSVGTSCGAMLILSLQCVIWWLYPVNRPTVEDRKAGDNIVELIRGAKGDVLTERRVTFATLAGRRPEIDACTLRFAYEIGRAGSPDGAKSPGRIFWDPAELVKALDEKRFAMVILAGEFFPPEAMSSIMMNYRELKERRTTIGNWHGSNKYYVLVPR